MKNTMIDEKAVQEYLLPQLKVLKSFLMSLKMDKSVQIVMFLQYLVDVETKEHLKSNAKMNPK